MSSIWGSNLKISVFGESHGEAIGVVLDGLPAGEEINFDEIKTQMKRRRPGSGSLVTSRDESDAAHVVSGLFEGKTTGTPFCAIIYNENASSKDYEKSRFLPRPSHADFTAHVRYKGFEDFRGGGHFSGRLTASLVFAGAVCRQILEKKGITIGSHIASVGDVFDEKFNPVDIPCDILNRLAKSSFPVLNGNIQKEIENRILEAKAQKDSVGGVIECALVGVPCGVGNPIFDNIESKIASLVFGIPGVKGVEFGGGFELSRNCGSKCNDNFTVSNGVIKTVTNNSGGILGGISSGMPIIFRAAFKPTPSIAKEQTTVNLKSGLTEKISIEGRHDPCIAVRAAAVVEAAAAIAILDLMKK